jgi:CRP-like cAMP-binding protein
MAVTHGFVKVVLYDGVMISTLNPGDMIGEASLLGDNTYRTENGLPCEFFALSYVTCLALSRSDFQVILNCYDDGLKDEIKAARARWAIRRRTQERWIETLRTGAKSSQEIELQMILLERWVAVVNKLQAKRFGTLAGARAPGTDLDMDRAAQRMKLSVKGGWVAEEYSSESDADTEKETKADNVETMVGASRSASDWFRDLDGSTDDSKGDVSRGRSGRKSPATAAAVDSESVNPKVVERAVVPNSEVLKPKVSFVDSRGRSDDDEDEMMIAVPRTDGGKPPVIKAGAETRLQGNGHGSLDEARRGSKESGAPPQSPNGQKKPSAPGSGEEGGEVAERDKGEALNEIASAQIATRIAYWSDKLEQIKEEVSAQTVGMAEEMRAMRATQCNLVERMTAMQATQHDMMRLLTENLPPQTSPVNSQTNGARSRGTHLGQQDVPAPHVPPRSGKSVVYLSYKTSHVY